MKPVSFKKLLSLFFIFFKVGSFTIGGGLAMLPLYREEFSEKRDWVTTEDMLDMIAITQTLPGVFAANLAGFIGYRLFGPIGAVVAVMGSIMPSFIIIILVGIIYSVVFGNIYVVKAFKGVRCAVAAMIIVSGFKMFKDTVKSKFAAIVAVCVGVCVLFFGNAIIYAIIASAAAGIIFYKIKNNQKLLKADSDKSGEE